MKHFGNLFQPDNSIYRDCNVKRPMSISIIHCLKQEFLFFEPTTVVKLYNNYKCIYYIIPINGIFSVNNYKLYTSWNSAISFLFGLPDRVSNASGFYLHAIASPCTQVNLIARNSAIIMCDKRKSIDCTQSRNSVQFSCRPCGTQ